MVWVVLMASLFVNVAFADAGKIIKVVGGDDAYVLRKGVKIPLGLDVSLEVGDDIHSSSAHLIMLVYPETQLSLPRQSELKLIQATIEETPKHLKSNSVLELLKGQVRSRVTKNINNEVEHTIKVTNAAFAVRGTEFEIRIDGDDVDLDVEEGEVEFSSPLVHTFVPEIIKRHEGFRFSRKNKMYLRRKFDARLNNMPGFLNSRELKERFLAWKDNRSLQGGIQQKLKERMKRINASKDKKINR